MSASDPFGARAPLGPGLPDIYRLSALARSDSMRPALDLDRLPVTIKILLENVLRHAGGGIVRESDVAALAAWRPGAAAAPGAAEVEIPFMPARVILQDFTGVPAVVDLAAMRDAMAELGGDPSRVNPLVPADLVIDHSVQVDRYGTAGAFAFNVEREYERNGERYQLLRWAQTAFDDLRVVPPGTGIVHQVNLEYLASVVTRRRDPDGRGEVAFPDTLVGTDSHTTMINGLGVLGYGVGGIEAEAVLLGQPLYQPMPRVIGVRLSGELPEGATATDLVLVVTQMLRSYGVVGAFVEFTGDGLAGLALADRATISNMSPEFGPTATLFPIDDETLAYLRLTGRAADQVALVERYAKEQGLWRLPGVTPEFDALLTLDLGSVEPSLAGPRRPQDRVALRDLRNELPSGLSRGAREEGRGAGRGRAVGLGRLRRLGGQTPARPYYPSVRVEAAGRSVEIATGSVAIAAITSCTNTSNPTVMVAAGLLARNAVARGLGVPPTVKTSLAPGSRAVTAYLRGAGLLEPLEKLGFALAGYGCTTCIGNSGPLDAPVAKAIEENDLVVAAVLSGNRNFEGRIHPLVRASYLASPPLVVAFALAGTVDVDLTTAAARHRLGRARPSSCATSGPRPRRSGPPSARRSAASCSGPPTPRSSKAARSGRRSTSRPATATAGTPPRRTWRCRPSSWGSGPSPAPIAAIEGARVLASSATRSRPTTSPPPARSRRRPPPESGFRPTACRRAEFNCYGARRGHHEVMMRGTFANIRLRNALAGARGAVHRASSGRRGDDHLRRGDALRGRRRAAHRHRRQGVRLGVVARLGGQGPAAARRPGGHRRELRADPPFQPGRHGHPAAAVPPRRERSEPRPDGPRVLHDRAAGRRAGAAGRLTVVARARRRGGRSTPAPSGGSRSLPGWTARSSSTTTARAASCRPS